MRRILSDTSKSFIDWSSLCVPSCTCSVGSTWPSIFLVIDLWHILLWHVEGLAVNQHHDVAATCCSVWRFTFLCFSLCLLAVLQPWVQHRLSQAVWCVVLPGTSTLSSTPPGAAVLLPAPPGTAALLEELGCCACSPRSICLKNFFVSCSLWCGHDLM